MNSSSDIYGSTVYYVIIKKGASNLSLSSVFSRFVHGMCVIFWVKVYYLFCLN